MSLRTLLATALTLALSGTCAAQATFRGDAARNGVSAGAGPRQIAGAKWAFQSGDRIMSSPVLSDGRLYFGSDDGNVYALAPGDGTLLWRHATGGPVPASPTVADGSLYAASYDGKFYALDARTGELRWKFRTEGERRFEARGIHGFLPRTQTYPDIYDVYLSSAVVADGTVYFGSGDGNVYALAVKDGALRWKFTTGDVVHASPTYADGVLYVGSWDGKFYAIDAGTGKPKWSFQAGLDPAIHNQQGFQSSAAVVDGVVYVGCRDSHLYAFDAATGKEKWNIGTNGSWVVSSPAVHQGKVYFATSDSSQLHIAEAATGKILAQYAGKATTWSSPTVAGDVLVTGSMNGSVEGRDLASGEVLWTFQSPAARRNAGWVLDNEGRFNATLLYPSVWREALVLAEERQLSVGAFASSALIADGTVYIGSADGKMYALQ